MLGDFESEAKFDNMKMVEGMVVPKLEECQKEVGGYMLHWQIRDSMEDYIQMMMRHPPRGWLVVESDWMETHNNLRASPGENEHKVFFAGGVAKILMFWAWAPVP